MTEEIQKTTEETAAVVPPTPEVVTGNAAVEEMETPRKRFVKGGRPQRGGRGGRGGRRPGGDVPAESDYEEKNIEVARVTRVTKGGKRMRFRVLSVIGNHKGRVGFGLAKGLDVAAATSKATTKARKSLITVPLINETIPHPIDAKFAAARILLKPAPKGTGVKAGGPVRSVLELAGVPNVTAKILGSKNKINNVKAVFVALKNLAAFNKVPVASTESAQATLRPGDKPTAV
jgi:small subunit ribosomal protein S5